MYRSPILAIQNSHNPKMFARFKGKKAKFFYRCCKTIRRFWPPFKAAAIEFGKEMGRCRREHLLVVFIDCC